MPTALSNLILESMPQSDRLRFVHTTVHGILGVSGPDRGDLVLVDDRAAGIWACLTKQPEEHCKDADESLAISTMLFGGDGLDGSFEERLKNASAAIREDREPPRDNATFLVLRREGEVRDWESKAERETDRIVIRLNGAPRNRIQDETKRVLAAVAFSLSLAAECPIRLTPHTDAIVFLRSDGKKLFAKKLSVEGRAVVSSSFPAEEAEQVQAVFRDLVALADLSRVLKLFAASLEASEDRLRSFLSGWSALEIFVNKVFRLYERRFFDRLMRDELPDARLQYVDRIRDVMRDKYRLRDRFALVASTLAPDHVDTDSESFKDAKKKRDGLAHGQDVDEKLLPVAAVHELLRRYLHLHAAEMAEDATQDGTDGVPEGKNVP